ncbi:MAG: hypothetical protein RIS18_270 [Actinomycetota bacterium]|jgi:hypothetical protein
MKLSKLSAISLSLLISITFSVPTFAEDSAPETPAESSAPASQEPAYTPPPEALNGVGGWAVVDPVTGNVHGVVVCTNDVCGPNGSWGGKLPGEYMGCTNCNLRFQTRATDDGNVAGWHGTQTNVDANENASQNNDGSVKWNEKEKNFTIKNTWTDSNSSKVTRTQTLIPEKTASDGKNLQTGIIDIYTQYKSGVISGQNIYGSTFQNYLNDKTGSIELEFPNWAAKKLYFNSPTEFIQKLDSDVEELLSSEGYLINPSPTPSASDNVSDEQNSPDTESEDVIFVKTIKTLTSNIKTFFSGLFGLN